MNFRLLRAAWTPLVLVVLTLAIANWLRHGLVEPLELAARCDTTPWQGWDCILRSATVQVFAGHRLGTVALVCGVLAFASGWLWLARLALVGGCAGLVLYSVPLAAPAVLLAGLAWVRVAPH